jgi:formylglycine-generating enzyme required for sulfatase activity
MKKKMRNSDGEIWNNITWGNAKKEADKLGYRLPSIQEMLVLLDWYKHEKGDNVSCHDKEFLGIEELSYDEDVCYEWIDSPVVCVRGGNWDDTSDTGCFALYLNWSTSNANCDVGFRCAR